MDLKPQLAGRPWRPLFAPQATGCYVNDHSVIRTRDGRWHVIGITKMTPAMNADQERHFCHGSLSTRRSTSTTPTRISGT